MHTHSSILKRLFAALILINLLALPAHAGQTEPKTEKAQSVSQNQQKAKIGQTININKAGETELRLLKGIGKKKAQRIIAFRKENGAFKSIEALTQVKGVSLKIVETNKARLTY